MQKMVGTDNKHIKISVIVMSFIGSFIIPFFTVIFLHDILHFSKDHWYFRAPISAYVLCFFALFLFSMFLTTDEIIRSKREDFGKNTGPYLIILSFVALFLFHAWAANNYYFFDDQGLHYNRMFELKQRDLQWGDFSKVEQITTRKNNMEVYKEHIFHTKSGETYVIPFETNFREHRGKIIDMIEYKNIPIEKRYVEPE